MKGPQGVRSLLVGDVMVVRGNSSEEVLRLCFCKKVEKGMMVSLTIKEKEVLNPAKLNIFQHFLCQNKDNIPAEIEFDFLVYSSDSGLLSSEKATQGGNLSDDFLKDLGAFLVNTTKTILSDLEDQEIKETSKRMEDIISDIVNFSLRDKTDGVNIPDLLTDILRILPVAVQIEKDLDEMKEYGDCTEDKDLTLHNQVAAQLDLIRIMLKKDD